MNLIDIVLVADFRILRESLQALIAKESDMRITGEASDGFEAVKIVKEKCPSVVILEPYLPNKDGIDITKEIISLGISAKILVLTSDQNSHSAIRMLRAGAMGWLSKSSSIEDLLTAIRCVNHSNVYLPELLQKQFAERYIHPDSFTQPQDQLSDREFQVLRLLALGNTNKEISKILFVGVKTIDTHRANLLKKLGLRNNADLTRFAIQNAFIRI